MKVAKLVYVSLMTRVIVDDDATEAQILDVAKPRLIYTMNSDLSEIIEEIVDDEEVPYDPNHDKQ